MAELSVHAFTVYDLITRGAAVHREAPAVIQGDRTVSFGELKERVDALAAGLSGVGIARGDRVCVLAQNDVAYLDLYGACARQASSPIRRTASVRWRRRRIPSSPKRPSG